MLVLSRKKNQKIEIGPNVILTVIDIRGDKVRLGLEAPREVSVDRGEVAERKRRERPPAVGLALPAA